MSAARKQLLSAYLLSMALNGGYRIPLTYPTYPTRGKSKNKPDSRKKKRGRK